MQNDSSKIPVLIAGAGPTGLVLAISLARRGIPFRLIDDDAGPGEHSRAMVVQARTLEFYQQFGFAREMIAEGVRMERAHLRYGDDTDAGRELASLSFKEVGQGLSPFPFVLAYPQDDHERFLVAKLTEAGARVEWSTKLTSFTRSDAGVVATVTRADGSTEQIEADYLCGCDGAHSVVRQTLGIGFPGGTYSQLHYVADVRVAAGFVPDLYINLGNDEFVLMLPVRSRGVQRLIGLVPPGLRDRPNVTFDDLRAHIEPLVDQHVTEVNWFATYRVHHRVAEHFRVGRAFLLGDAGHIHSPAGGQGMNTGIGDAINLGWKLAMVIEERASEALLDTYETERIEFARQLVSTTDRLFTAVVAGGLAGTVVRRFVMPLLFTIGTSVPVGRRAMFRLLSQIEIDYEDSALSDGEAGRVASGDRLPWVSDLAPDNFAPLESLGWQAHVYGAPAPAVTDTCTALGVPLHTFAWTDGAKKVGLEENAVYLIRPDGYVGLAAAADDANALREYARAHELRFG